MEIEVKISNKQKHASNKLGITHPSGSLISTTGGYVSCQRSL